MKKILVSLALLPIILMASCQNKKELPSSSTFRETSDSLSSIKESSGSNSSTEDKIVEEMLWNADKDKKLNDFMNTWGETMNQTYRQYSPNNNVDLYGLQLPDSVLNNKWQAVIGNTPIVLKWSESGEEESGYSLVAVYSDAEAQEYLSKHVYFFTINSGVPKVLITSQNQGNPNNYLYFKETDNKELRDGFSNIVNSSVTFDDVKSNFTKDEQLSYFISDYGQLPYKGYLTTENDGKGTRITYYVDESIPNDKQDISEAIEHLKAISLSVQQKVGEGITVSLKEPLETEYTLTLIDGQPTQANHIFGRMIKEVSNGADVSKSELSDLIPSKFKGNWRIKNRGISFILEDDNSRMVFGHDTTELSNPRIEGEYLIFDSNFRVSGSAPIIYVSIKLTESKFGIISFENDRGEVVTHDFLENDR